MSTIIRKPVTSSQIKSIGHDPATNTLAIEFSRGGVYHYANVTAHDYRELIGHGKKEHSVGSHFFKHIKANADRYPYTKQ